MLETSVSSSFCRFADCFFGVSWSGVGVGRAVAEAAAEAVATAGSMASGCVEITTFDSVLK